jgi:hypothetical protein
MLRCMFVCSAVLSLCLGVGCTLVPDGGPDGDPNTPDGGGAWTTTVTTTLDNASAAIRVAQNVGAAGAEVTATLTDSRGRGVLLTADQYIRVNGVDLVSTGAGHYAALIPAAPEYLLSVREPTRGVEETSIDTPGDFAVASPAPGAGASLSGFALAWSAPNNHLDAEVHLSQTLFGNTQTVSFGPFEDQGSRAFTAQDLVNFRQGAELGVVLTKVNKTETVAGFRTGSLSVALTVRISLSPLP